MLEIFSKRLKELRIMRNLTQKQLGEILGCATSSVSNWENGIREPDLECLKKFAKFFNVSSDYLLGLKDL